MAYVIDNVFWRILRKDIPCTIVLENEFSLAFHDINPKAAVHILVIPKGQYVDFYEFHKMASIDAIAGFYKLVTDVVSLFKLQQSGFQLITRSGINGRQEVPHFHVHILGGELLNS
ncbi:MAG: HIT domain-containing protein [Holosporales bacterium]|jgi:diadenosine tetraphosphate (Ap4A) HIT family hydrolase|nr:HIT domain-containing protein [Holosporales bacterium]